MSPGPGSKGAIMDALIGVLAVDSNLTLINIFAVVVIAMACVASAVALKR